MKGGEMMFEREVYGQDIMNIIACEDHRGLKGQAFTSSGQLGMRGLNSDNFSLTRK